MKSTVLAMGLICALAGFASAAPQSIGDCEKIADPDAYNRCLAAFGPAMRPQKFTNVPSGTATVTDADTKVSQGNRGGGRGYRASRRGRSHGTASSRHGRVRVEIPVGESSSKASRRRGRRH